jgi:hypothetical protein
LPAAALLWSPVQGVLSLTFVPIAFFLIDGIDLVFAGVALIGGARGAPRRCVSRVAWLALLMTRVPAD